MKSNLKMGEKKIGENIAMSTVKTEGLSGDQLARLWYQEKQFYNKENNSLQLLSENFTQMVWKDTKEVGFGISQTKTGEWVAVANYYPSGNVNGKFQENVLNC